MFKTSRTLSVILFSCLLAVPAAYAAETASAPAVPEPSGEVAMVRDPFNIQDLLQQPVKADSAAAADKSVKKETDSQTKLPVYRAEKAGAALAVAAADRVTGVKEIKVGSGTAIVATGVAAYKTYPNPNASRLAKRQAYVEGMLAAKQEMLKHLTGLKLEGQERLVQDFYRKDTAKDALKSDSDAYRESIKEQVKGIIRGYITYSVDDDMDSSMVYVSIVSSPATRQAGRVVSGGLVAAEDVVLGVQRVHREVRAGLVPPVGGRIVRVPETGETALVSFGSAIVRVEENKAAQARERLNAGKQAKARADKALVGIITGDEMTWQYGTDTRQDKESANFERIVKEDPYGNELVEEKLLDETRESFVNAESNSENYKLAVNGNLPPGVNSQTFYAEDGANCYVVNVLMQSSVAHARRAADDMAGVKPNKDHHEGENYDPGQGPSGKVQEDSSL